METLTETGIALRDRLSLEYGVSAEAVRVMMDAVSRGGGTQAQFSHPEFGGMGQWSMGGMTMVGDMFNHGLQALVSNLCADIAAALSQGGIYLPRRAAAAGAGGQSQSQGGGFGGPSIQVAGGYGDWWPDGLGHPASVGSQNDMSYAIFPETRRLALNIGGRVRVYDTGDHRIGGVSQQQSGDASWTFTSQHGTVYLRDLARVDDTEATAPDTAPAPPEVSETTAKSDKPADARSAIDDATTGDQDSGKSFAPTPSQSPSPDTAPTPSPSAERRISSADDIFAALEKLGQLRDMGVLTEAEFTAKKTELIARL